MTTHYLRGDNLTCAAGAFHSLQRAAKCQRRAQREHGGIILPSSAAARCCAQPGQCHHASSHHQPLQRPPSYAFTDRTSTIRSDMAKIASASGRALEMPAAAACCTTPSSHEGRACQSRKQPRLCHGVALGWMSGAVTGCRQVAADVFTDDLPCPQPGNGQGDERHAALPHGRRR